MSISKKINMKKGNGLINKMKTQQGFTLIELVVVVVILGFLAVTAIPKFLDLTEQAKQANIEGMAGGFATGVSLARAQWEAEGRPKDASDRNSVNYDGTVVYLTVEAANIRPGYIIGSTAISAIAGIDCIEVWNSLLQQPPLITADLTTLNTSGNENIDYFATKTASATDPVCHYYLKETLARNSTTGDWITPGISTTVGNSFTYQAANSRVIIYVNN